MSDEQVGVILLLCINYSVIYFVIGDSNVIVIVVIIIRLLSIIRSLLYSYS